MLGIVAFWAAVAALFWQALKPYRLLIADLWALIPPAARPAAGIGLAIAAGILVILVVIAGIVGKNDPVPPRGTARRTRVGVDLDEADLDGSDM
ncbi:hypothetical protein [Actinoplanes ianthinogenes]|uniref:hypothetical protein n=1 Tax=Actinoplanes ianthinogenes TaxID=122358 RepID=UPI001670770D|nr:hypothetical protein [Actinoplanes ianthinogenes]